ncbi:RNA 2',3'-cyclic phosphodiesterase [Massilia endophytica]|uniref:RNA 2',3'-cyclic phosphodiesterase n=1 Tax=Massilia endophytica TaxID=2899220 RepID=UPI001E46A07F|nr:RNA 2',3'-cyclic phosphodiesterase [Massilia endophytica]UGQ45801.1 RNA 2',3'-cyclic phosphodiesterase [Massilia endophytica]
MIANHSPKLFFALWPDDAVRSALAKLQAPVQGRLIPPEKLHLTLAFLGHQPAERLPVLRGILESLSVPPLRLEIDCYGYFTKPRIAWAGMSRIPPELNMLYEDLMAKLGEEGFAPATHGAFRPHITLAREAKAAPPRQPFEAVIWEVREAALVESVMATGQYLPLAPR